MIDDFLNNVKDKSSTLIVYGLHIYKFNLIKYKYFDKLFKNYFSKKYDDFLLEFFDEYLEIDSIKREFTISPSETKEKTIFDFYVGFFKKMRIHIDKIINNLKGIKSKESIFRDGLLKKGIEKFLAYYHEVLSNFLKLELKINKQNIFIHYGSDLKKILYEELLSITTE